MLNISIIFFITFKLYYQQQIIIIPLETSINPGRIYNFYFENYTHPISLTFTYSFSYIDNSFFLQRYSSPTEYPLAIEKSKFFRYFYLFKDKVSFKGHPITFDHMFYARINGTSENDEEMYVDRLSLRFSSSHNNRSLVYLLHEQRVIPYKIFTLNIKHNCFILGGLPSSTYNLLHIGTTMLSQQQLDFYSWHCDISEIQIGDIRYVTNNTKGLFNLDSSSISIPSDVFRQMNSQYFQQHYNSKNCYWDNVHSFNKDDFYESGMRIWCKQDVIKDIPDVVFRLGTFNVKIIKEDMFKCEDGRNDKFCLFEIADRGDYNVLDLGTAFLKGYFVMFDYDKTSLSFYMEVEKSWGMVLWLYNVLIGILCVGVGVNILFIIVKSK